MYTKGKNMIEICNVSKKYGDITALDDVSFVVNLGEIVALLGQNGAGKSTLLKVVSGYLQPDGGVVKIFNKTYDKSRTDILQHIGYVPENSLLYPDMCVYDYLKMSADLKQIAQEDFQKNVREIVEKLQLSKVIWQKNSTLSKGYKKRVEIAGELLHKPDILILDEPTEGLDPSQKEIVRGFLREYGKTNIVLISTHILEEVYAVASRVIMLGSGKLTADISKVGLSSHHLENLFK